MSSMREKVAPRKKRFSVRDAFGADVVRLLRNLDRSIPTLIEGRPHVVLVFASRAEAEEFYWALGDLDDAIEKHVKADAA